MIAPTLFHGFPYFIFEQNEKGELLPVPWDSEWAQIQHFDDRRTYINRNSERDHRKLEEGLDFCVLSGKGRREKERRKPREEWKGLERRNPLKCEICQEVFPDQLELAAHLCCRSAAYYKFKRPGFLRLVELVRRRGVLMAEEVNWFRKIILTSLSEKAFLEASKSLYFRSQLELPKEKNKEKNYQRFRVEWLLCLLSYIRPDDKLNPRLPNRQDWQDVLRIEEEFFRSERTRQSEIVREVFNSQTPFGEIAKGGQGRPPIRLSPQDREAIKDAAHLHGKKAAEFLTARGVNLDDGRTPKQLYDESPGKFYQWHRGRNRIAGVPPRKPNKAHL